MDSLILNRVLKEANYIIKYEDKYYLQSVYN